eukprot:CAMPEP_0198302862 /NCGR_PEP_ID=MMETSP1449-20131203/56588_1 /TAXON_ID=420275 /ORGANISM="Attheya septentrionalis, Strain CCMP2084" /LENGTH=292 /DNA_ID=CAMNT_0044005333 /DNA_START=271 /DNA_END=1149 /DNA_ORIENTATION=-
MRRSKCLFLCKQNWTTILAVVLFWIALDRNYRNNNAEQFAQNRLHTHLNSDTTTTTDSDIHSSILPTDIINTTNNTKRNIPTEQPNFIHPGCEGTVILVRHSESENAREYERAVYLSTLFGPGKERWPTPAYLYALFHEGSKQKKIRGSNDATSTNMKMETLQPLSVKTNRTIHYWHSQENVSKVTKRILALFKKGHMCGKTIVVAWKQSEIPRFAHHLGCSPTRGCPSDYRHQEFDLTWQIKFVYQIPWHSSHSNEKYLWNVHGSVQREGFDPLALSKKSGDYPPGGTPFG